MQALRAGATRPRSRRALARLKDAAARDDVNLMPAIVDAARAYVTMGEMCDALRERVGRVARDAGLLAFWRNHAGLRARC